MYDRGDNEKLKVDMKRNKTRGRGTGHGPAEDTCLLGDDPYDSLQGAECLCHLRDHHLLMKDSLRHEIGLY
jgi:hypothetical protein